MTDTPALDHTRLNQGIADVALLGYENQEAFMSTVGQTSWEADLHESRLTLGEQSFRMTVLGSWSEYSNTWLWSWANSQYGLAPEHPCLAPTAGLRARADELGMPEFGTPQFSVAGLNNLNWAPGVGLAMFSAYLLGANAIYTGGYDGGRLWMAVLDAPPVVPNPIKFQRLSMMAFNAACESPTDDGVRHRQTCQLYAYARNLQYGTRPDGILQIDYPHGSKLELTFDEHGRMVHDKATICPDDVPPRLPFEEEA